MVAIVVDLRRPCRPAEQPGVAGFADTYRRSLAANAWARQAPGGNPDLHRIRISGQNFTDIRKKIIYSKRGISNLEFRKMDVIEKLSFWLLILSLVAAPMHAFSVMPVVADTGCPMHERQAMDGAYPRAITAPVKVSAAGLGDCCPDGGSACGHGCYSCEHGSFVLPNIAVSACCMPHPARAHPFQADLLPLGFPPPLRPPSISAC